MKNWQSALIPLSANIIDTMKTIESNPAKIALVVDDERRLLGSITDGDIRRSVMSGKSLEISVGEIMNKSPLCINPETTTSEIMALKQKFLIRQFPIVNSEKRVVGIKIVEELEITREKNNWAVLMAGGMGTRLRPLTEYCPKPLLPVGDRPIIETIIQGLIAHGIRNILISINYKGDMIEDFCGNGERWDINIKYLRENKSLGTAGALSLVPEEARSAPILVMNGDLLTRIDYSRLLAFHEERTHPATMCIRKIEHHIPYGIVNFENHYLQSIEEKPQYNFWINAGIYVFSPDVLSLVPNDQYFDMNNFFTAITGGDGEKPGVFPVVEYWSDVGLMSDYKKAQMEYDDIFAMQDYKDLHLQFPVS